MLTCRKNASLVVDCSGVASQFQDQPDCFRLSCQKLSERFSDGLQFVVIMPAFQTLRQQTLDRIVKAKLADATDGVVIPTIWSSKVCGCRAGKNTAGLGRPLHPITVLLACRSHLLHRVCRTTHSSVNKQLVMHIYCECEDKEPSAQLLVYKLGMQYSTDKLVQLSGNIVNQSTYQPTRYPDKQHAHIEGANHTLKLAIPGNGAEAFCVVAGSFQKISCQCCQSRQC